MKLIFNHDEEYEGAVQERGREIASKEHTEDDLSH